MPIKLPKGFQRRKSSGNALEENPNPPQPSFRVFERTPDGRKSLDSGGVLRSYTDVRPMSDGQHKSFAQEKPSFNRGSGGTQNSNSTGGLYDASSSARFSSSSTLPSASSIEAGQDDVSHAHPKPPQKAATSGFSLRAAGRTFSFGTRKSGYLTSPSPSPNEVPLPQQHNDYHDIPDLQQGMRQRAMTETSYASGSTATPPKLLDTDFGSEDDGGFGDIFSGVGGEKRKSQALAFSQTGVTSNQIDRPHDSHPAPLRLDKTADAPDGPNTGASQNSRDGLMTTPRVGHNYDQSTGAYDYSAGSTHPASRPGRMNTDYERRHPVEPRSSTLEAGESPTFIDEDTRLAMRYMGNSDHQRGSQPKPLPRRPLAEVSPQRRVTLYDGDNQDHQGSETVRSDSIATTPRAKKVPQSTEEDSIMDDLDFERMAISADMFQERSASPPPKAPNLPKTQGKVMTPLQFERYRKEQESLRNQYASKSDSDDEDSESDKYDEDDEEERNKEMARQRRRQDAQMSVYRQQMMKVTGEQQPLNSTLPRGGQGMHSANGTNGWADRPLDNKNSEDEDEDIPLGILAAHGFPSKDRPPSHLNQSGLQPNIRYTSEAYPAPPQSASGVSVRESTSMPAFARNLPRDPFFGASLVNPTERQSLAFGSSAQSVHGGSQAQQGSNSGGLVGVIAKEERARAMRRGSPNTAAFEMPDAIPPGQMHPDQHSQMQMSQMTQMMQMQMQWMQQIMALQGIQGQQGMPMPPAGFPAMPMMPGMQGMPGMPGGTPGVGYPNNSRPNSMGEPGGGVQRPQSSSRSMNMLSPDGQPWPPRNTRTSTAPSFLGPSGRNSALSNVSGFGHNGGSQQPNNYASSLAPSERSNIGLAPRYRPVSTMPGADEGTRSNTMGSSTLRAWDNQGKGKAAATLRVVPGKKPDDEDDDEGWEEMKKKREKKRSLWRGRKADKAEDNALEGVFYPTSMD